MVVYVGIQYCTAVERTSVACYVLTPRDIKVAKCPFSKWNCGSSGYFFLNHVRTVLIVFQLEFLKPHGGSVIFGSRVGQLFEASFCLTRAHMQRRYSEGFFGYKTPFNSGGFQDSQL